MGWAALKTRSTILLTTPRSVTGLIEHGESRLSDAINNPLESVLRVENALLGRLNNADANGPFATVIVPKDQIALVYSDAELRRTGDRRLASYVAKQTTEVLVLVAGLRVHGHAHASAQLDPIRFHHLVTERQGFIAITDASLALDVEGTTARDIGVAFINLRHVQFLAKIEPARDDADPRELALAAVVHK